MKKVILSLLVLAACMTIQAAEINQQQAMEKAKAFLSQRSGARHVAADLKLQTVATGIRQLHAFNMEGGGYVIVSASNRTKDILAYAPEGALGDQIPPAMMELLKSYASQITEAEQSGDDAEQDDAANDYPVKYEIAPLVRQKWGQDKPYNNQTPIVKDQEGKEIHGLTGCVATAMAMVMKYHQWPKTQTPTLPATQYTSELPPVTFSATDAYVCDSIYMQTAGRYNMTGSFIKLQNPSAETFAFADGQGGSVVPKATSCSPFRACFQAIGMPTGFESLTIDTTTYNPTAIEILSHEVGDDSQPYYNLSGQRVVHPRRGLYIRGGRKVVMK